MADKLNILVLHQMGFPHLRRKAVFDLEYMLPNYASQHNYIVHDCDLPLPEFIKDVKFHAIVLGPTFLCNRYTSKGFQDVLKTYDFIRESDAFKIAMPQDDYDCSEFLDNWMVSWKIDIVFSVLPKFIDILYPNYLAKDGIVKKAYTGYISDELVAQWQNTKEFHKREIDVSYRASLLPANFGELGYIKGAIAQKFVDASSKYDLKLDISTNTKDMIPGNKWHEFMENSKFCLATNSGSDLLDKTGSYRDKVNAYIARFPKATFTQIRDVCFLKEDMRYEMTAISPRNIEAILANTVQIAIPGEYSELLVANEHYIPLESDCKNIDEVVGKMKDISLVSQMAKDSKELILDTKELYYKNHVNEVIELIENGITKKNIVLSTLRPFHHFFTQKIHYFA